MENEVGPLDKRSHVWTVRNYSRLKKQLGVGKAIVCSEFTAGGHLWEIAFYPNGQDSDAHRQGYASVNLTLKTGAIGGYPVQFLHEIYVVSQSSSSGGGVDCGFSLFKFREAIPCLRRGQHCGVAHFVKRAVIESPDYLRDDCLRIRCTVGVLLCLILDHPLLRFPGPPALHVVAARHLKEICSSLSQGLVRLKQTASSGQGELDLCNKILSVAKRKVTWRWDASNQKVKIKED